jgi:hypothetical protein
MKIILSALAVMFLQTPSPTQYYRSISYILNSFTWALSSSSLVCLVMSVEFQHWSPHGGFESVGQQLPGRPPLVCWWSLSIQTECGAHCGFYLLLADHNFGLNLTLAVLLCGGHPVWPPPFLSYSAGPISTSESIIHSSPVWFNPSQHFLHQLSLVSD